MTFAERIDEHALMEVFNPSQTNRMYRAGTLKVSTTSSAPGRER